MKKKWISLILVTVGGSLALLFFCAPSRKQKCNHEVLTALQAGDFSKAELALCKLHETNKKTPFSLYKAHLELAKGNLTTFNDCLEKAKRELALSPFSQELFTEILYLEASYAYITHSPAFVRVLEKLQQLPPHRFFSLFEALYHYSNGNYSLSKSLFEQYLLNLPIDNRPQTLLEHTMSCLFPPSWMRLRFAHTLIAGDEIQRGRELIESEMHRMSSQTKDTQLTGRLFLGFSYLKEAEKTPYHLRQTLYKLTSFYLKSLSSQKESLQREKVCVVDALANEIITMIQNGIPTLSCEESSNAINEIFAFIHILEEWGSEKQLDQISKTLGEGVLKSIPAQEHLVRLYCQAIKTFPSDCPFRSHIINQCKEALLHQIQRDDSLSCEPLWQILKSLEVEKLITNQVAYALIGEFPRIISRDSSDLTRTQKAIAFYQTIENNPSRHEQLATACANFAKILWKRDNEEKKATHLMQLALNMTPSDKSRDLRYSLSEYLTELYLRAESCNTRRRMCCILDAFNTLKCGTQNLTTPSKIANTIADGEYLLEAHQYPLAETTAEWVLKVSPRNEQALRLLGLSCFHQGEYQKAIAALDQLSHHDEEVTRALAFCQILETQECESHLAHHKPFMVD